MEEEMINVHRHLLLGSDVLNCQRGEMRKRRLSSKIKKLKERVMIRRHSP
jgi:hypothetical protein